MQASQAWLAPAKINLFLHITGRRDDGMHHLQTAFQFINLCDELTFTPRNDAQIMRVNEIARVPAEQDLCVRAARLLQAFANVASGVDIAIRKVIPSAAGLGGASSDAATTLLVLNKLWSLDLPAEALVELGRSLGADIPVFMRGHAAWAEGIGDQLTPVEIEANWYVIANPGVPVSTGEMFAHSQLTRNCPTLTICSPKAGEFGNVFEPIVRAQYPKIDSVFGWLSGHQCKPFLTGSGGCVAAAFATRARALAVQADRPAGIDTYVVEGLNQSPLFAQFEKRFEGALVI